MGIYSDIYTAMNNKFGTLATTKSWTFVVDNEEYTPVTGNKYFEVYCSFGTPSQQFLGELGQNKITFTFHVLIHDVLGEGYGNTFDDAEDIIAEFKRGVRIATPDFEIVVQSAAAMGGYKDENGWFTVPVFIRCTAYTPN